MWLGRSANLSTLRGTSSQRGPPRRHNVALLLLENSSSCFRSSVATTATPAPCRRHLDLQAVEEGSGGRSNQQDHHDGHPQPPRASPSSFSAATLSAPAQDSVTRSADATVSYEATATSQRPMTMTERFRHFPLGVAALYRDFVRYKNIRDASRTRLNAWTLDPPCPRHGLDSTERMVTRATRPLLRQDSAVPGRVPRRQREQQRQFVEDLRVVLPLVVAWLPPVVGYLPMVVAALAPRLVLSRHFWNEHEVELFAFRESAQRRHFFARVAELLRNATAADSHRREEPPLVVLGSDAAGPVIDPRPLFAGVLVGDAAALNSNPCASFLRSVDGLPDEYLVPLALASGCFANFGGGDGRDDYLLPRLLAGWCAPRRWLRSRVRRAARAVAEDDALLIEEGAHVDHCRDLTDDEVRDACLLRGLPLSGSASEMRQSLSNHLAMVALVHLDASRQGSERRGRSTPRYTEAFGLLSLHLAILRGSLCGRCAQERAVRPPTSSSKQ